VNDDVQNTPTVAECLRLGHGVHENERDEIVESFAKLDHRLRSFRPGSVDLLLSVKERETPSQRTTLEAWIGGFADLVATSTDERLPAALTEVRDDLIRQITDHKNRTEPRNHRHLRDSISEHEPRD
jgi:ribosome-associated translation inhibitor RaiA